MQAVPGALARTSDIDPVAHDEVLGIEEQVVAGRELVP